MSITKLIDPKRNKTFNVEKVKLNKAPRHFFDEDITVKKMTIDGQPLDVRMRKERTQYVLFQRQEGEGDKAFTQSYYVRDHDFFASDEVVKYVKPAAAPQQPVVEPVVETVAPIVSDKHTNKK